MDLPSSRPAPDLLGQLVRNSFLMVLARTAGALSLIFAVPVIVAKLGPEGYGVWESLLAVAGVAMIFQVVINGTILWRISRSYGKQDAVEARRLVQVGIGATLTLVAVLVPLVLLLSRPLLDGLQIHGLWALDARWVLPSLVAILLLGGVNESLASVITGYQRAGLAALIKSAGFITTHLTAIALLFLGLGLDALLIGYLVGWGLMFVVFYPLASTLCGRISLLPRRPSAQDITVLGSFAAMLLISNLSVVFRDHVDKVVLASMDSPATTGYFSMAQRLSLLVMQICAVLFTPFGAAIAALHAQESWQGVRELYARIAPWFAAIAGLFGFLISTLHEPLFVLWLGESQPQTYGFLAYLLLGVTAAIIFSGPGTALAKGIGRPGLETTYTLVTLVLTLLSKPLLVLIFGPVGAVASSAACWAIGSVFLLLLVHRKVDLPGKIISRSFAVFGLTAGLSAVGWWAADRLPMPAGRAGAGLLILVAGSLMAAGYLALLATLRLVDPSVLRAALRRPDPRAGGAT